MLSWEYSVAKGRTLLSTIWLSAAALPWDFKLLAIALPLLVFPGKYAALGLAIAGMVGVRCWVLQSELGLARWAVLALAVMTILATAVSSYRDESLPKFDGLVGGLVVFLSVAYNTRSRGGRRAVWAGLVLLAGLVAVVSLGGTAWKGGVLLPVAGIQQHLPSLFPRVTTSHSIVDGFPPNEVAGTMGLLLPLPVARLMWRASHAVWWPIAVSAGAVACCLILTESLGAWLGAAAGLMLLLILRRRHASALLWAGGAVLAANAAVLLVLWGSWPERTLYPWAVYSRLEIWLRCLTLISRSPLLGVGLNTLPLKTPTLEQPIFHAHNLVLQTALDLGLPGLVALLLIVGLAIRSIHRHLVACRSEPWMAVGLGAGLVSHLVFSLSDAVTLGAKPGLALWAILGLSCALT